MKVGNISIAFLAFAFAVTAALLVADTAAAHCEYYTSEQRQPGEKTIRFRGSLIILTELDKPDIFIDRNKIGKGVAASDATGNEYPDVGRMLVISRHGPNHHYWLDDESYSSYCPTE